jgi:hypothetical protein
MTVTSKRTFSKVLKVFGHKNMVAKGGKQLNQNYLLCK